MKPFQACIYQGADRSNGPVFMLCCCFRFRTGNYFYKILALVAVFSLVSFSQRSQSQTPYRILTGSQVTVSGTSTLHQWSMQANDFKGEGNFVLTEGELKDVTAFQFMLPVTNLKSKEKQMDNRAYKALKAHEHDKITFKLTDATVLPQQKIIRATGDLTLAGVTNQVELQTAYAVHADQSITCKASQSLKMSDYHIQPPKFMMGKVKTGDEVTVNILLQLKP